MKLYELTGKYLAIYELIERQAGEIGEELEAALLELEGAIEEKLEKCGHVIKSLEGEAEIFEARAEVYLKEGKRFKDKAKALENECNRIKKYVIEQMQALGESRKKTPSFSLSVKETQAVNVVDESQLQPDYLDYKPVVRKSEIAKDLKAGIAVPGAELITNYHLNLR